MPGTGSPPPAQRRARDATPSEGLPPARYPVSKTGGPSGLGGSTPSPSASRHRPASPPARRSRAPALPRATERTGLSGSVLPHYPLRPGTLSATPETRGAWRHGRARQGSALLARRRATVRRFESCCLRSIVPVWSSGETRDCYSRSAGSNPAAGVSCPCGRSGDDAGLSTRKLRVRIPPGVLADRLLAVGEQATPPVSGTGDRRFDSCQPDLFLATTRGRGAAVLASLMSSRPWVRIPPAPSNDWPADGRAKEVTEQGLVQSAGPNVQLASTSLQGQPVRRWRRGHALAGVPMGNSWLRSPQTATSLPPVAGSRSRLPSTSGA